MEHSDDKIDIKGIKAQGEQDRNVMSPSAQSNQDEFPARQPTEMTETEPEPKANFNSKLASPGK